MCVCVCVCAQGTAVGRLLECLRSSDKQTVRYAAGALRNIAVEESGRHQVSKHESARAPEAVLVVRGGVGTHAPGREQTLAHARTSADANGLLVRTHAQTGGGGSRGACQVAGADVVAGRFHGALCVGLPQESQHSGGAIMYTRGERVDAVRNCEVVERAGTVP